MKHANLLSHVDLVLKQNKSKYLTCSQFSVLLKMYEQEVNTLNTKRDTVIQSMDVPLETRINKLGVLDPSLTEAKQQLIQIKSLQVHFFL